VYSCNDILLGVEDATPTHILYKSWILPHQQYYVASSSTVGKTMDEETITVKTDNRGRITIPGRLRDYVGIEEDSGTWWKITVHGLDPEKHPESDHVAPKSVRGDGK